MSMLLIGSDERARIAALVEKAANTPLNAGDMVEMAAMDRQKFNAVMETFAIDIPKGYRVAFSHEVQPAGLFRHISISVDRPRNLPDAHAVAMICKEFGLGDVEHEIYRRPLKTLDALWVEDLSDKYKAVNILQRIAPPEQEGTSRHA